MRIHRYLIKMQTTCSVTKNYFMCLIQPNPERFQLIVSNLICTNKWIEGKRVYQKIRCCRFKTGWHCCSKTLRNSDFTEYGIAITLYFKFLKFLMAMFTIYIILSIPMYVLYDGGKVVNLDTGVKQSLSILSMGYVGEGSTSCMR